VAQIVREATGAEPEELHFVRIDDGLVAYLTVRLGGTTALSEAHARASEIEETVRSKLPDIADVIVHTEPLQ
jgi:divalent metal cation (Fe/Co/Zn/Cd) transporter